MAKLAFSMLVFLGVSIGLAICSAHAREDGREVESINELIKDKKAKSNNAKTQEDSNIEDEMDKALAQLFSQMLEEQAMAEKSGEDKKLAEAEGLFSFFRRIKRWFKKAGRKIKHAYHKAKNFFHRRRG